MSELQKKIRSDSLVRAVFRKVSYAVLVGGYLRDVISGDRKCNDYDFAVKRGMHNSVSLLQGELGGTVVDLGKKEGIVRLALKGGRHLDFSRMQGPLPDDLARRDFTVNALGWTWKDGLIDPCNGARDIREGTIRAVSEKNLVDDPLRLLRAYRFMAEKGWKIEPLTRDMVCRHAKLIRKVAAERVTCEMFLIIHAPWAGRALEQCNEDSLLSQLIPLKNNELHENIKAFSEIRRQVEKLPQRIRLKQFPQELTQEGLFMMERLALGADPSKWRLSFSRHVETRLQKTSELFHGFMGISKLDPGEMFGLFSMAGDSALDLLVLTGNVDMYPELKRFDRIQARQLLNAEELMEALGLKQGPEVGRALKKLKRMQFQNIVKNKRQAISKLKY
jgi:tRNA nucleotidyltransferase (CCA-adding enzyme)